MRPRSICTFCRIPSHAGVKEMSEGGGKCPGGNVRFPGERAISMPQCSGVVNLVNLVYYTFDRRARRG